jgi:hypothetical protein
MSARIRHISLRSRILGSMPSQAHLLAWLCAGVLVACGTDRLASSEIGNPPKRGMVVGVIFSEGGQPAPNTRVGLLPAHYDPVRDTGVKVWFDTTDAQGAFAIDSVDSGSYNIQALQLTARTSLLIQGVEVRSDTTVASERPYLRTSGAISILLPDSVTTKNGYVYLPGTDIYATTVSLVGESRLLYLDSVPAGSSPEIVYRSSAKDSAASSRSLRLSDGVTVVPGDTIPASTFQEWAHSSRVFLNTTSAGANMTTLPVFGFPVLVRLGPGANVFSSAAADGHDLRFTKANGIPLAYEIESWDKAGSQAAIWVRVDTVLANDSDQYIRMYWGNPSAERFVPPRPVFDTGGGYQGIWHMGSMSSANPPVISDASNASNPLAAGGGLGAGDQVPSPMGLGLNLDGDSRTLTTAKEFDAPGVFTISLWFKTVSDSGGKLIGFGQKPDTVDAARDRQIWMDTVGVAHFGVYPKAGQKFAQDVLSSAKALNDGQWHHVGGVLWSGGQVFYVDGRKAGEDPAVTTAQGYLKGYWKVGFDFKFYDWPFAPTALYFKGQIDEVRVSRKSFPKEWMLLSYESQKPDSRFLRFDKP